MDNVNYLSLKLPGGYEIKTPPKIPEFGQINNGISLALALLFTLGVVASIIFILYAGIMWVTSEGDKQKIETARATLTYAIIGLIIMVFVFVILSVLGSIIGVRWL